MNSKNIQKYSLYISKAKNLTKTQIPHMKLFNFSKKSLFTLSLAVLSIVLYIGVLHWGVYLTKNMVECFTVDRGDPSTNHTVDLPINTSFSCKNMCGPNSRCSITGDQCSSDIDCPGCQPPVPEKEIQALKEEVPGYDDSGKLTTEMVPRFSVLTTDIGTQAGIYKEESRFAQVPSYNIGYNIWRKTFDDGSFLFHQKYTPEPEILKKAFAPQYQKRTTLSGEFTDVGPLPSNAEL